MGPLASQKYHQHKTENRTWFKLKKRSSEENRQQQLAGELLKPIKPTFTRRRVIVNGIDKIWCSDLVEMQ